MPGVPRQSRASNQHCSVRLSPFETVTGRRWTSFDRCGLSRETRRRHGKSGFIPPAETHAHTPKTRLCRASALGSWSRGRCLCVPCNRRRADATTRALAMDGMVWVGGLVGWWTRDDFRSRGSRHALAPGDAGGTWGRQLCVSCVVLVPTSLDLLCSLVCVF